MLVINIIPPKKNVEYSSFVVGDGELPLIAAHRGGGANNPENTLLAFREAVNTIGVDIIVSDITLSQLRQYNFGYYFEDENGERIYKDSTDLEGLGLQIATVDQLFNEFS